MANTHRLDTVTYLRFFLNSFDEWMERLLDTDTFIFGTELNFYILKYNLNMILKYDNLNK